MKTGERIKNLRIEKGMTQEELADKTEVSTRTIQRIENNEVDPRAYTLQMIAKALDVDYQIFTTNGSDDQEENQQINENNWLAMLHLSGILPLLFPTFLIWNKKKNKITEMGSHYRVVISYQLMMQGIILGCLWVYWKTSIITPLYGILFANALLCVFNALQVMNGKSFQYGPFKKTTKK